VGQKVHPKGFRIGIIRDWDSNWYADRDYTDLLHEDYRIRTYIKDKFYAAGISRVEVQRTGNRLRITIHTAKPGIIIGRGGNEVEMLKDHLTNMTGKNVNINILIGFRSYFKGSMSQPFDFSHYYFLPFCFCIFIYIFRKRDNLVKPPACKRGRQPVAN
jgi:predicted RNA-binding protein YlqC (UPF0109 family)